MGLVSFVLQRESVHKSLAVVGAVVAELDGAVLENMDGDCIEGLSVEDLLRPVLLAVLGEVSVPRLLGLDLLAVGEADCFAQFEVPVDAVGGGKCDCGLESVPTNF